jgi:hypothetical protein
MWKVECPDWFVYKLYASMSSEDFSFCAIFIVEFFEPSSRVLLFTFVLSLFQSGQSTSSNNKKG